MLLVQNICLIWNKEERGAKAAQARAQFPMAYPWEMLSDSNEVLMEYVYFYQEGTQFVDVAKRTTLKPIKQYSCSVEGLDLANLSICCCSHEEKNFRKEKVLIETGYFYDVIFFYDEHRSGKPFRRGHNKDYNNPQSPLYRKDCLNERAFMLEPGQYGRISWNERLMDFDTGEWYYRFHVINLYHLSGKVSRNIFLANNPDFEYKQVAALF